SGGMAYDLLIKNGTVIDGTGAPRYEADVAVKDGRIAEIGKIGGGAGKVIDAAGCVVAPGFIDPHTHYDAQICWDPAISPSLWHGVTSVVMGNCGVGIAPCRPEARAVAMRDLVNVEAIPFEVLNEGITWDWVTFAAARLLAQSRLYRAVDPIPALGDGRSLDGPRRDCGGDDADRGADPRGGRCRRLRLFDDDAQSEYGIPGAPARLP